MEIDTNQLKKDLKESIQEIKENTHDREMLQDLEQELKNIEAIEEKEKEKKEEQLIAEANYHRDVIQDEGGDPDEN